MCTAMLNLTIWEIMWKNGRPGISKMSSRDMFGPWLADTILMGVVTGVTVGLASECSWYFYVRAAMSGPQVLLARPELLTVTGQL